MPEPYLSVVVCSRNDDHGGGLLGRMQTFIDGLAELCARYALPTELILVEWNPPWDRPSLSRALSFPNDNQFFTTRLVQVPESVHRRIRNSENLQIFQMIAKNAGIARAKGDFVLTTNVDLLFSDGLMRFLSQRSLQSGCYYRADRYDVQAGVPRGNIEDELSFCHAHVIRVNRREATYDLKTGDTYWIYAPGKDKEMTRHNPVRLIPLGFLGLASWYGDHAWKLVSGITKLNVIRGRKNESKRRPGTSMRSFLTRLRQLRPHPFKNLWPAGVLDARVNSLLRALPSRLTLVALRNGFRLAVAGLPSRGALRVHLDTNASGDFILMSREDWCQLRGYPEFQTFSMHLDSLLLYQAYYSGIREVILPYPIYHMAHTAGWGTGTEQTSLVDTLEAVGIRYVSYPRFLELVKLLSKSKDKHINGLNWGLMDQQLAESNPYDEQVRTLDPLPEVKGNRKV